MNGQTDLGSREPGRTTEEPPISTSHIHRQVCPRGGECERLSFYMDELQRAAVKLGDLDLELRRAEVARDMLLAACLAARDWMVQVDRIREILGVK